MSNVESVLNQRHDQVVAAVDGGVIGTIFSMFTSDVLLRLLETVGHYVLFPLAAILSIYRMVLAMRQATLDKFKYGTLFKAAIEIISTAAILTAVIGGLAATTVFALISPIIFTAVLAAKSFYHFSAAIYYLGKSNVSDISPDKKDRYRANMQGHLKGAVLLTISTIAVGLVMLAAHTVFAWVGIAAAVLGIGISVHNAVKAHRKIQQVAEEAQALLTEESEPDHSPRLTSTSVLHKPSAKPSQVSHHNTHFGKLFRRSRPTSTVVAAPAYPHNYPQLPKRMVF